MVRHVLAAAAILAAPLSVQQAPAPARLIAAGGGAPTPAARLVATRTGTVDLATVAPAADHHLGATLGANEQPSIPQVVIAAVDDPWTAAAFGATMKRHCAAHGAGRGAELNCQVRVGAAPASDQPDRSAILAPQQLRSARDRASFGEALPATRAAARYATAPDGGALRERLRYRPVPDIPRPSGLHAAE